MTDKPRVNKSKEEILADMKANVGFQKKMAFVKDKFWPALCKASTSVEDATILLEGFNTTLMQTFLARMKEVKIEELELATKLDAMSDKFIENRDLLGIFNGLSVFEAKEYIEGMRGEIQVFQRDEMQKRPLESLKTKWADEAQEELLTKK